MKKNKNILIGGIGATLLFPIITFAALDGVMGLLKDFMLIIVQLFPIVIGLAFIFFFWGVAQFILNAGNDKTREDGKKKMLWGIIALFVIVSIVGIIQAIGSAINIDTGGSIINGVLQ